MPSEENSPEEIEGIRKTLYLILKRQVRLIDYLLHALSTGEGVNDHETLKADKKVIDVILMMVHGMGVTAHSILKLSESVDMQVRDSLVLSRAIVETGINVAYIIAGGSEKAELAERHALQKTYRNTQRSGRLGGMEFTVSSTRKIDPSRVPGLEDALKEFTGARGSEERKWTPDNIDRRLELIAGKFSQPAIALVGAMVAVYRDSSEILHGTYFGVIDFWTSPAKTRRDTEKHFLMSHFVPAVSAAYLTLMAVVQIADNRYGLKAIAKAQEENWGFFLELFEQLAPDTSGLQQEEPKK